MGKKDTSGKDLMKRPAEFASAVNLAAFEGEVHYGMPVKDMLYDAINYAEQITLLSDVNRTEKKTTNPAEFLSGITKEDRLIPVVTIVLFLSAEEWDGPMTLHDMLDFEGVPEEELEKERVNMCKAVVELKAEGRIEGIQQGLLQVYHNMINANIPEAQARKLSGVTDEMLANEKKN